MTWNWSKKMPPAFALVLGVLFCGIGSLVATRLPGGLRGGAGFADIQPASAGGYIYLTLSLAMLLGIIANGVWNTLTTDTTAPDTGISLKAILTGTLSSRSFLKSIVVSPIVFASIYAMTKNQPDAIVGHLLAFENGFFWNTVLEGRRAGLTVPRTN